MTNLYLDLLGALGNLVCLRMYIFYVKHKLI